MSFVAAFRLKILVLAETFKIKRLEVSPCKDHSCGRGSKPKNENDKGNAVVVMA